MFYNTVALSRWERRDLSDYTQPEGSVVVVYPGSSSKGYRIVTAVDFVNEQSRANAESIDTIVVAGVGSSALGTASLARDVADYKQQPVAGIISGLGLSDIMAEALGGWFIFGRINAFRHAREMMARILDYFEFKDHVRHQRTHEAMQSHFKARKTDPKYFLYGSPDSTALLYLLSKLGSRIKLLVGHSKGNYSIENALEGYQQLLERSHQPLPPSLRVITLSAVVCFGHEFTRLKQYIGTIDFFGMANSRFHEDFVFIANSWHSLNTAWRGHLPVAKALRLAGIPRGDLPPNIPPGWPQSGVLQIQSIEGNGKSNRRKRPVRSKGGQGVRANRKTTVVA